MLIVGYKCEACNEWAWTPYIVKTVYCAKCGNHSAKFDGLYELKEGTKCQTESARSLK